MDDQLIIGAVLCGGASRRMGRDKALIELDGRALAVRVADALRAGGCREVVAVGGDAVALARVGLTTVVDRWPGEGPLGGLATALVAAPGRARAGRAGDTTVVLAPCDLLTPSSALVASLVSALDRRPDVDASVPRVGGRLEWTLSAWRLRPGLGVELGALVGRGVRRLDALAEAVRWAEVTTARAADLADADHPEDLPPTRRHR